MEKQHGVVFSPKTNTVDKAFDGAHTCDPSVVVASGAYYMYYTGYPSYKYDVDGGPTHITKIGVARSYDGVSWTRLNSGNPIIVPHRGCLIRKTEGDRYMVQGILL